MSLPWTAVLIGLWSAGHCLAMCGGLAIAAGQASRQNLNNSKSQRALELLAWQFGRILSYSFFGFIAAGFGTLFFSVAPIAALQTTAFIFANLLLIALGLHVAQVWSGITQIERLGQVIWRWVSPFATATLIPKATLPRNPGAQLFGAIRAGAIWGWLPCGLVYSMLLTSSVTGSATQGALWMLGFGLGTIPALWLTSFASHHASDLMRKRGVRLACGGLIITFGLWGLLRVTGIITVDWLDGFCIGGVR